MLVCFIPSARFCGSLPQVCILGIPGIRVLPTILEVPNCTCQHLNAEGCGCGKFCALIEDRIALGTCNIITI